MATGRKPVDVLAKTRKPSGRDAVWAAIRDQRARFSLGTLREATDVHRDTIRTYLRGLEAAGFIRELGVAPPVGARFYALVKDIGREAPRVTRDGRPVTQGRARENMWRTMKMLVDFTATDLAVAATTEETEVSEVDAKDYVQHLAKAGYLVVVREGTPKAKALYRFVKARNTGPKPPMVQRIKSVFDPNLRRIVWCEEVGE